MPRSGVEKVKKFGRGPIEQCVEEICFVPRGGVKTKIRSRTGGAVC